MNRAILFTQPGGPERLELVERPLPTPGPGEALVRHRAIGVNFIDTYHRSGLYPLPLPSGLGVEAVGVVEATGQGCVVPVGRRVAYIAATPGCYADARVVPADRLLPLPDGIDDERAAAVLLKGLTAYFLLHRSFRVEAGSWLVVHAATGGVGSLLCPWAHSLGATVIGVVGSEAKIDRARALGCAHVLLSSDVEWPRQVRSICPRGVDVVYDSVGRTSFDGSLDCLRPFGLLVSFGQASGPIPPFDVGVLARKGSLYLTRMTLFAHLADAHAADEAQRALFARVLDGSLRVDLSGRFALADAASAHRELEARRTQGSLVLVP